MSLSKNIDFNSFYSFLEKAWQPIWLANFVYCYLFVDIVSFYLSGSGIFYYSLLHVLDLTFANIIITITVFGIFSILILPIINTILRSLMIEISVLFSRYSTLNDNYTLSNGYVSLGQLSDKKLVKYFKNSPDYLTNIYTVELEKYNIKLKNLLKLECLILGIIIFSIIEIIFINRDNSNTLSCYLQNFFENKEMTYFVWFIYITSLLMLLSSYYFLCNSMPRFRFYNPILYEQIQNIKID
jgi:hypothetical protein